MVAFLLAQELQYAVDGDVDLGSLGQALASYGDADGDGVPDFAAGAPNVNYDIPGFGKRSAPGEVVFFSGASLALRFRVSRNDAGDDFGRTLVAIGDVDGDGIDDLLAGAPGTSLGRVGVAVVLDGAAGTVLASLPGDYSGFGEALAALGDVDGDAVPDFAIGSPARFDAASTGGVHVYSGATNALLRTLAGDGHSHAFGYSLARLRDVDGDGVDDLAVGDASDDSNGGDSGSAWLFSTATGAVLQRVALGAPGDRFGISLASAPDADGDGLEDLFVGAPGPFGGTGRIDLLSSATGALLGSIFGAAGDQIGSALARLDDLDGDAVPELAVGGYEVTRPRQLFDGATWRLLQWWDEDGSTRGDFQPAGDVDGDGRPDLLHGVPNHSSATLAGCGRIELLSADDLYLHADRRALHPGDVTAFHVRAGAAGQPVALFVVAVDGSARTQLIDLATLDGQGRWDGASFKLPSGVGSHSIELVAFSLASARLVASWREVIETN